MRIFLLFGLLRQRIYSHSIILPLKQSSNPFLVFRTGKKLKSLGLLLLLSGGSLPFAAWFYHVSLRKMVVPNRLTHLDVATKAIWNFLHWITYSCCWKIQSQLLYFLYSQGARGEMFPVSLFLDILKEWSGSVWWM